MTHPPVFGDQRRKGSDLRRSWDDTTARDLLCVVTRLAATVQAPRVDLEVCDRCGALERAGRACQICLARKEAELNSAAGKRQALVENVEWLIGTDRPDNIARRVGYAHLESLTRRLYRAGRADLVARLDSERAREAS